MSTNRADFASAARNLAYADQRAAADAEMRDVYLAGVPQVGTWRTSRSSWYAGITAEGAAEHCCAHIGEDEANPSPMFVFMPYPSFGWCPRCWPAAITFFTLRAEGGLCCYTCTADLTSGSLRIRALIYYSQAMTAPLCPPCAARWDSWGDGIEAGAGQLQYAYRNLT